MHRTAALLGVLLLAGLFAPAGQAETPRVEHARYVNVDNLSWLGYPCPLEIAGLRDSTTLPTSLDGACFAIEPDEDTIILDILQGTDLVFATVVWRGSALEWMGHQHTCGETWLHPPQRAAFLEVHLQPSAIAGCATATSGLMQATFFSG